MTPEQEIRRFIKTGDHDPICSAWTGGTFLEKANRADHELRTALLKEMKRAAAGRTPPPMPAGHDAGEFVLGRVTPMVRGLFPAKEQQAILDVLKKGLVFVSQENVDAHTLRQAQGRSAAATQIAAYGLRGFRRAGYGVELRITTAYQRRLHRDCACGSVKTGLICPFSKGPEHVCTQIGTQSQKCPPELLSLIKAWPSIPRHLQAAILPIANSGV